MPTREIAHVLDCERSVIVQTDGQQFGLIFRNGEDVTKCLLSDEAMRVLASSYAPLSAGRGEEIEYEWRAIDLHKLERAKEPTP